MNKVVLALATGLMSACTAMQIPAPLQGDLSITKPQATAVFAGGCFWCVEAVFENVKGVSNVVSGYSGGSQADANYEAVGSGRTKHAEAIEITYDPKQVSYGKLLHIFFATHYPTQKNRQGPDVGTQYRSAVFYQSEQEKAIVEAYIQQLTAAKVYGNKEIATTLEPFTAFYPAEDYHQDFVALHPNHPYVHAHSLPRVATLKKQFPDSVAE